VGDYGLCRIHLTRQAALANNESWLSNFSSYISAAQRMAIWQSKVAKMMYNIKDEWLTRCNEGREKMRRSTRSSSNCCRTVFNFEDNLMDTASAMMYYWSIGLSEGWIRINCSSTCFHALSIPKYLMKIFIILVSSLAEPSHQHLRRLPGSLFTIVASYAVGYAKHQAY
jgi:hypothetical protein